MLYTNYEKVGPVVSFNWPGHLGLRIGERIKVIGYPKGLSGFEPHAVIDSSDDVQEYPGAHEEPSNGELKVPLVGKVVACQPHGNVTIVSIFPTQNKAFHFQSLASQQPFLLVPEFWSFIEDRADWEDIFLRGSRIHASMEEDEWEPIDVRDVSWQLYRMGHLTGNYPPSVIPELFGVIVKKLERSERLKFKAAFLDDLRRHLIACYGGRRDAALEETLEEGAILLETASTAVYSVLDVFAHLVNVAYGLGIPQLQCGFTMLLGPPLSAQPGEVTAWKTLPPGDPLYECFVSARDGWLGELRALRHFVAHTGYVLECHGPSARALASWMPDAKDLKTHRVLPVQETVAKWVDKTRALIDEALNIIQARAESINSSIEIPFEAPAVRAANSATDPGSMLDDFVRLLCISSEEEPQRVKYLYSKLDRLASCLASGRRHPPPGRHRPLPGGRQ